MHICIGLPGEEACKKLLINKLETLIGFCELFDALSCLADVFNLALLLSWRFECSLAIFHCHVYRWQLHQGLASPIDL